MPPSSHNKRFVFFVFNSWRQKNTTLDLDSNLNDKSQLVARLSTSIVLKTPRSAAKVRARKVVWHFSEARAADRRRTSKTGDVGTRDARPADQNSNLVRRVDTRRTLGSVAHLREDAADVALTTPPKHPAT
ncbi:hypothetical protein ISCGN_010434 [Ixodes scapularis]